MSDGSLEAIVGIEAEEENITMATSVKIGEFDVAKPEQWEAYEERLEQFLVVNKVTEEAHKRANLITVIGNDCYQLLRNLLSPKKPKDVNFDDQVKAPREHFNPRPKIVVERFNFHSRAQHEGENVSDFIASLRKLAATCGFNEFLDEALRDRFVVGLRNRLTQQRLLQEDTLTLTGALTLATAMEAAERGVVTISSTGAIQAVKSSRASKNLTDGLSEKNNRNNQSGCFRCNAQDHWAKNCPYRSKKCSKCGRVGHKSDACRTRDRTKDSGGGKQKKLSLSRHKRHGRVHYAQDKASSTSSHSRDSNCTSQGHHRECFEVRTVCSTGQVAHVTSPPYECELELNGKAVRFQVDTGADKTLINEKTSKQLGLKLSRTTLRLSIYTDHSIPVLGEATIDVVSHNVRLYQLPVLIVKGERVNLLGRDWLSKIKIDWDKFASVNVTTLVQPMDLLVRKHEQVFAETLGTIKGLKANIVLKENLIPKYFKSRPVPFAIKGLIEDELKSLQAQGIITKVKASDFASPIVPVLKRDGKSVRICADFKRTVNPQLEVDKYPLPRLEEIFATLNGGKYFTKLDISQAFLQLELEESCRRFTTINTHLGLFQYNRLTMGLASAPAQIQEAMEKILQGLDVVVYIDDILVSGTSLEDHDNRLNAVLERLSDYGVHLNRKKCEFRLNKISFLGYVIDENGLHPSNEKVEAIHNAQAPTNATEVRSLIGMITYYAKFIPNLSSILVPLNRLLCKESEFRWSEECNAAFDRVKKTLTSDRVLAHFDPKKQLVLQTDASKYGIGCVISHVMPNGDERPVAYASRTLSKPEINYSQLEKEALAIVLGVKRFHQYLFGHHFVLVTDHKPLLTIFGDKKDIPSIAASRLQRWAVLLSAHQYTIKFRRTEDHSNADALSRLPDRAKNISCDKILEVRLEMLPITAETIRTATRKDAELRKVVHYCQNGWPETSEPGLEQYFRKRNELCIEQGVIFWGLRVVIPRSVQRMVLELLHDGHPGIVAMKSIARLHVWFPGIDSAIEDLVRSCEGCQLQRNLPAQAPVQPLVWPEKPWTRIQLDYMGPFHGYFWLIIVDATSKWVEIFPMKHATTSKTIECLRDTFTRFGIPQQVLSDNGSQFCSSEFRAFLKRNNIRQI
ncbi:hypothetical protein BOX15_Mlig024196g4 [Macrostomum lignano]|uniref:Reverse transcriptase n=1 Tax=Macrostomum lignano TaxID=282301 RepID=A0A267G5M8_9PLAT|nr:hypothetical protein BOX15_Mlig024196g4 [Macrostomum lignano]